MDVRLLIYVRQRDISDWEQWDPWLINKGSERGIPLSDAHIAHQQPIIPDLGFDIMDTVAEDLGSEGNFPGWYFSRRTACWDCSVTYG